MSETAVALGDAAATDQPGSKEVGHFAASQGVQLHYHLHNAPAPRGGVLILHGFAEHGGRYNHVIEALLPRGFSVMTYDHRGHGHSGGRRVFVERFGEYVADAEVALELAVRRMPQPLYVLGHSMGGVVALLLAAKRPPTVKGWILSNPALHAAVAIPAWKVALARGASRALPGLSVPSGIPPEHISRDADEVRKYGDDQLNSKSATARWYTEFTSAQDEVLRDPQLLAGLPLLALIGEGDLIIDPKVSLQFLGALAGPSVEVQRYPGLYHELFNEIAEDRAKVFKDLVHWLQTRPAA